MFSYQDCKLLEPRKRGTTLHFSCEAFGPADRHHLEHIRKRNNWVVVYSDKKRKASIWEENKIGLADDIVPYYRKS